MAKSNGFFGMRRGSTKSLTFSVLNGKQITKDRVAQVANPKSQKQQYQRAIMATVMAAYSEMKDICDHSFQGKKKGSECQREFMSANLTNMRQALVTYQEENPTPAQQKFFAIGPKTPTTLPCEWLISKGSLKCNAFVFDGNSSFDINYGNGLPVTDGESGSKKMNVGQALDAIGLKEGQQFTFCFINFEGGGRIFQIYDEDYAGYGDWAFYYGRYIIKSSVDRTKMLTHPTGEGANAALFVALLNEIRDSRSNVIIPAAEDWNVGEFVASIGGEDLCGNIGFDTSLTGACGVIVSMVDEDLRSTTKMTVISQALDKSTTGLTWDYIWDAWRKSGATLGQSDLYLEGGEV